VGTGGWPGRRALIEVPLSDRAQATGGDVFEGHGPAVAGRPQQPQLEGVKLHAGLEIYHQPCTAGCWLAETDLTDRARARQRARPAQFAGKIDSDPEDGAAGAVLEEGAKARAHRGSQLKNTSGPMRQASRALPALMGSASGTCSSAASASPSSGVGRGMLSAEG